MPIKLKKTVSISAVTGNSVLFNGSNQYLSVANTGLFGSGSWTFECWINAPVGQTDKPIIEARNSAGGEGNSTGFTVTMITPTEIRLWCGSQRIRATANYVNQWLHIAVVKNNTTTTMYFNGVSVGTTTLGDMSDTSFIVGAGYYGEAYINAYGNFYTSNMRVVKGSAVYTSAFTPSTSPLTAIANTVLLTCQSPTIIDNSTNNFTITNNNTATVSSAVVPFTTSFSVFKLKKNNANPVAPYSVLFNGSNQYLTVGSAANWTFLHNGSSWTAECWFNVPSASLSSRYTLISTDAASAFIGMDFNLNNTSAGDASFTVYKGVSGQWPVSVVTSGNIFTPNTWNHIAAVYNSGTSTGTIYMNGVAVASSGSAVAFSTSAPTYTLAIGRYQFSTPAGYLNGYISNLRITNSVLYTASFTPPTTPLTAITDTQLLTCNAATIVDASSNNFTITNNNTATVSSTITPFTASISTNKFKLRHVSYSSAVSATQKAIFGYGYNGSPLSMTNLVSNTGVAATDTTGVGTARTGVAATGYGTDKAIFGYGDDGNSTSYSTTNLVSNAGVVATDTTGVGTARAYLAAAGYGTDKAIFAYGYTPSPATGYSISNLVSNTGVVATNTTGVGTARTNLAAAGYGSDKALFGYGYTTVNVSMTNLVSNTGVVATDTTGVGTARYALAAAGYGSDKAIFGYGRTTSNVSMTNLVSNTGVVSTDTTGVGTARERPAAAGYGSDKAIFGYGSSGGRVSMTNKVSNTGVVSTDTTGVGTAREQPAAAGYSLS